MLDRRGFLKRLIAATATVATAATLPRVQAYTQEDLDRLLHERKKSYFFFDQKARAFSDRWSFDILYGAHVLRKDLITAVGFRELDDLDILCFQLPPLTDSELANIFIKTSRKEHEG